MAKEPPLDPPDYDDGPEPTEQEWREFRLRDMDYLVEDDEVVEAVDEALRKVGQALIDGDEPSKEEIGEIVIGAVTKYADEGDQCEVAEWQKEKAEEAAENFSEPDEPPYEPCHKYYDGTGKPWG